MLNMTDDNMICNKTRVQINNDIITGDLELKTLLVVMYCESCLLQDFHFTDLGEMNDNTCVYIVTCAKHSMSPTPAHANKTGS